MAELIGHSNIRKNDTVYDLGGGSGIISSVLANKARQVISVEHEPTALVSLRNNLSHISNVDIINSDIMSVVFPKDGRYKIFSNIPFSLSSPLVKHLSGLDNPPTSTYLIVQKQFANKLLANNRHFTSQLGASLYPWFSVKVRRPLRKTDYTPPPAVDTVLLEIKPRESTLIDESQKAKYDKYVLQMFETPGFYGKHSPHQDLKPSQLTGDELVTIFKGIR